MNLNDMLAAARDGGFYSSAAVAAGVNAKVARVALENMCPEIAARMKARAADDPDLFDDLVALLEDGAAEATLKNAGALTGKEAITDGNAILKDIYGSKDAAMKALKPLAGDVPAKALGKLAPIAATAVVAALTEASQPMALSGASTAAGSGGLLDTIVGAIVSGVVSEAKRQISQRTGMRWSTRRRSSSRSRKRKTPSRSRKATTRRPSSLSLEDIFRSILKS